MTRPNEKSERHLAAYDGREFIGAAIGAGKDWRAIDDRGNALPGAFVSMKAAVAAINLARNMSCVPDTNGRRDNT